MHRRSVFEPPKPKVDYPYYVFGTLEILIFSKCYENLVNTILFEPPEKPVLAMNGKRVTMRRVCQTCLNTWTDRCRIAQKRIEYSRT